MPTSLRPTVLAARGALGPRALALALLLLPLLAACSTLRGSGPDATIYVSSKTENVSALDAANGKVLWQYHCHCVVGMAVDSNHHTLFVTTDDSAVATLDTKTGKRGWRSTIGADGTLDKPYLVGSMVIAAAHPFPDTPAGESVIVALDARSGALLWRVSLPGAIAGDLSFHSGRLYASVNTANGSGSARPGSIYALRTTDGSQIWRATSPTTLVAGPVSDQTQVYAPTAFGSVVALRASDGALQWNQNISASGPLSALFANATAVYVGDGAATMRALSKADGSVLWTRTLPDTTTAIGPVVYTPMDGGSLVLLFSPMPVPLYALSPSDGAVVWEQEAGGGIPPYVLGKNIYMSSGDETIILTLANGRYAAEYYAYPTYSGYDSLGYTSAQQVDLGDTAHIVAGP